MLSRFIGFAYIYRDAEKCGPKSNAWFPEAAMPPISRLR